VHHVLALTSEGEMFTWGRLALSKNDDMSTRSKKWLPKEIEIVENMYKQKIIQVSCGYFHSMCLTAHYTVYSWGRGDNGRLGHGDSHSYSDPKLIESLKNEKIIQVSAGEKHSA